MKVGSLCTGYGGLELGLSLAGVDHELVWYAENDRHASGITSFYYPNVPNLGDLTQITDLEPVNMVTAGFPCQPVSLAGKREGVNDERWLIEDVCRIARRSGADWLILENVAGLLSANKGNALARVVSALAENGFSAEWTCVRASDVGAPHKRLRWFCVGYTDNVVGKSDVSNAFLPRTRVQGPIGGQERQPRGACGSEVLRPCDGKVGADGASSGDQNVAHPNQSSREARCDTGCSCECVRLQPLGHTPSSPNPNGQRAQIQVEGQQSAVEMFGGIGETRKIDKWGPYALAVARWEPIIGRPAPDATDEENRLSAHFVEWMMGLPEGWVTDIVEKRTHQLRILGNGVVPQQAAAAFALLFEQMQQPV